MLQRSWRPQKVLYVEDEVLVALDGETILRQMGFDDIVVALSFQDAERAMERERFDLAVLDINLGGGKTSLPLADALVERGTAVLFLTGYSLADALKQRVDAPVLTKPFDEESLAEAVVGVLGAAVSGEAG